MMQLVIVATRNPLGDGRYALAIAWPDQTRNVKRTHPPPRLVTQSLQKRLEPTRKPHLPVRPLHGRPLHKPTTHESLKSRFVNPHPHPEKQKSAKVVLGRGLKRSQPNPHGGELNKGKEVGTELVIACGDAAKLLQSVEEALDAVAFAIQGLGPPILRYAIGSVRDVGDRALVTDMRADVVGVIGLVGDARVDAKGRPVCLLISPGEAHDAACANALLDGLENGAVVGVDLCGDAASASAHTTISTLFLGPEAC